MRRITVSLGVFLIFAICTALPGVLRAQDLKEGMTQSDFALWLVKAIGAQSKLPPAAQGEDAIYFLTQLGSVPDGGWQKNDAITKEALSSLLEKPEEGTGLSFDDLVGKVRDRIQALFDKRKLGVFRVLSATPSLPAV